MASHRAIREFLSTLAMSGLMTERKGAPSLPPPERSDERKRARDRLATMWSALLADVSDVHLAAALASYLRDPKVCQWYPQPGQIIARVPGASEANGDDAEIAWGECLKAVRQAAMVVLYPNPGQRFDIRKLIRGDRSRQDAVSAALDAIDGPLAIINAEHGGKFDPMVAMRAAFCRAYRSERKRLRLVVENAKIISMADRAPQLEVER